MWERRPVSRRLEARFDSRAAFRAVLVVDLAFASAAAWFAPFLLPLVILLLLLPLFVLPPNLAAREHRAWLALLLVATTLLVGVAEWRRDHVAEVAPAIEVAVLLTCLPLVLIGIAAAVRAQYERLIRQTEQLRVSRSQVVEAATAARRDVERDLHDGAQQQLVRMTVTVAQVRDLVRRGQREQAEQVLAGLGDDVHITLQELRELAQGIYPTLLAERGLVVALRAAARRSVIPCTVTALSVPRHPEAVEAAVYFCVLEALQNAAKHSGAASVDVIVEGVPHLSFEVRDSGRGFVVDDRIEQAGLWGMSLRIAAAGGVLTIESTPGAGTVVRGDFARADTAGG